MVGQEVAGHGWEGRRASPRSCHAPPTFLNIASDIDDDGHGDGSGGGWSRMGRDSGGAGARGARGSGGGGGGHGG